MKIFVIGFQKTGTTSFEVFFKGLGYRVYGGDKTIMKLKSHRERIEYITKLMENWDVLQDMPWPLFYKELRECYPDAKFIYTFRNVDSWFNSVQRYFASIRIPLHKEIYGVDKAEGNKEVYVKKYLEHKKEVLKYFNGNSNFTAVDLSKDYRIEYLIDFLGIKSDLKGPFPKERVNNRFYYKYKLFRDLRSCYWNLKNGL